jgi:hypothetical protein
VSGEQLVIVRLLAHCPLLRNENLITYKTDG